MLDEYYSIRITSVEQKYVTRIIQDDTVFSEQYERLYDTSIKALKEICDESDGASILIWYKYIEPRRSMACSSGKMGGNKPSNKKKHRAASSSSARR
jgi:ethanolamine ammonia-lyase large subunit